MKQKDPFASYLGHSYVLYYNVSAEALIFPNYLIHSTVKHNYKPLSPLLSDATHIYLFLVAFYVQIFIISTLCIFSLINDILKKGIKVE